MFKHIVFICFLVFFMGASLAAAELRPGSQPCGPSMAEAIDAEDSAQLIIYIGTGCSPDATYTLDGEWVLPMVAYAVWKQNHAALKILIKMGADVNAVDASQGKTPLQWAITGIDASCRMARHAGGQSCGRACNGLDKSRCSYYDMVQTLIRAGADVNAQNLYHVTPLMQAASSLHRFLVVVDLIEAGADVSLRDEQGDTACDYLIKNTQATSPKEISRRKLIESFVCKDELL